MPKQRKSNGTPRTQAQELIKKVVRRVKRRASEPGSAELDADTAAAGSEPEPGRKKPPR